MACLDMLRRFPYSSSLNTGTCSSTGSPANVNAGFSEGNAAPLGRVPPMKRQPVITGLGIVSPIGIGVEKFWSAALAGRSGIGTPALFDASKLPPDCRVVGEVHGFNPLDWMPAQTARTAGRFTQFGIAAARMARKDSALDSAGISPED